MTKIYQIKHFKFTFLDKVPALLVFDPVRYKLKCNFYSFWHFFGISQKFKKLDDRDTKNQSLKKFSDFIF